MQFHCVVKHEATKPSFVISIDDTYGQALLTYEHMKIKKPTPFGYGIVLITIEEDKLIDFVVEL